MFREGNKFRTIHPDSPYDPVLMVSSAGIRDSDDIHVPGKRSSPDLRGKNLLHLVDPRGIGHGDAEFDGFFLPLPDFHALNSESRDRMDGDASPFEGSPPAPLRHVRGIPDTDQRRLDRQRPGFPVMRVYLRRG